MYLAMKKVRNEKGIANQFVRGEGEMHRSPF